MKALSPALASGLLSSVVLAILAFGCASRTVLVAVPPRIDLQSYNTIGVIDFTSEPADTLNQAATRRFMAVIQASQPNVRFLELGPMDRVLQSAGRERIDPETMRIVGRRYNVDTVFTGDYDISSLKPQLVVGQDLSSVSASARVKISVAVKHWDTKTGATLWTNVRYGEWPIARLGKKTGQPVSFSVSDPRDRYGEFLDQLIDAVTADFRVRYERRPAGKQ